MTRQYAAPLLALSVVTAAFFLMPHRPLGPRAAMGLRLALTVPLVGSGLLHLGRPGMFIHMLPPPFPQQAWLIVVTGIPELLGALGLFVPRTRKAAAICLALLMIAITPANIYIAGQTISGIPMPSIPLRTTMQAVYILLLLAAGWGLPQWRRETAQIGTGETFDRTKDAQHP